MATSDFEFPVLGVSGTSYRNKMDLSFDALISNHSSDTDPPEMLAYMVQAYTGGSEDILRIRNSTNTGWITLFPDLSQPNGGLLGEDSSPVFTNPIQVPDTSPLTDSSNTAANTRFVRSLLGSPDYVNTKSGWNTSLETFNHNLGSIPSYYKLTAICTSATNGYNVGDNVVLSGAMYRHQTDQHYGHTVILRTNSAVVKIALNGIPAVRLTDGELSNVITPSNWNLKFEAWL